MGSSEPDIPPAPQQKDTYIYDDNGNLSYSVVNEGGKMVYRPGVKNLAARAEEAELAQLKKEALGRISATPAEYRKMAQEAADAYAGSIQSGVTRQYEQDVARSTEAANLRGLVGSRAWVDTQKELARAKMETDVRTQQQATSMRDALLNQYQQRDLGLYNLYRGTSDAAWARMMSQAQFAGGQNLGQYSADLSKWQTESQNAMNAWQAEQANDPWNKYIMPTATTAAYAYGMGAFKPKPSAPSDRRLKINIKPEYKIGDIQFYSFEYNPDVWPDGVVMPSMRHIGVMADEVKHIPDVVAPEAFYGYDMVRYDILRRHLKMENA